MLLITGATGTSGSWIVSALAARKVPFRALVRDPAKAEGLRAKAAEVVAGDVGKPTTLGPALRGVETALLLTSPDPDQTRVQGAFIAAAKAAGVRRIVKFSALGADPDSPGLFTRLHGKTEQELSASGMEWTMVRPTFFYQNLLGSAPAIRKFGAYAGCTGERPVSHVDVRDVAEAVVETLVGTTHAGQVYTLTGPEALTNAALCERLSAVLGWRIAYRDMPKDQYKAMLVSAGLPDWMAQGMTDLAMLVEDGQAGVVSPHLEALTGRKGRRIDDFLVENKHAFR